MQNGLHCPPRLAIQRHPHHPDFEPLFEGFGLSKWQLDGDMDVEARVIGAFGYVVNITINNMRMEIVKVPIRFSRGSNDHINDRWDPKAVPKIKDIFVSNVVSLNTMKAPLQEGVEGAPYEGLCMKNVTLFGGTANLSQVSQMRSFQYHVPRCRAIFLHHGG
ncbi:hypothetical protein PVL29_011567 [Vitis rotundifolia]|uniref:Uncharacterized protein n=1 Tax=Vitis rotundifolia TaxID=103349 RepID=A0AA39DPQ7_VITRO|nr:hypothetical protein PVL29_011567 [Vitis rotundifolia]